MNMSATSLENCIIVKTQKCNSRFIVSLASLVNVNLSFRGLSKSSMLTKKKKKNSSLKH